MEAVDSCSLRPSSLKQALLDLDADSVSRGNYDRRLP